MGNHHGIQVKMDHGLPVGGAHLYGSVGKWSPPCRSEVDVWFSLVVHFKFSIHVAKWVLGTCLPLGILVRKQPRDRVLDNLNLPRQRFLLSLLG
ncbi:hypothetical protein NC653_026457 [Populus alba x Populus x berolinensis]|uniref:Uncharacterized protein n=1 Tax=Populus alba x Populus x berolinensis TaxID=444605 RepID=A0AAD6MDQ2_9ROSI|nr:hypothetical protein NC653_026457 [Populus alba x Populus x berolinensis]